MMQDITVTTYASASDGAVYFVALFTDGRSHPSTFNAKDRSKIALHLMLLCGIIDNGEVFKFDGGFCFMSFHLTMVANPCSDFSRASNWIFKLHHLPMRMNGVLWLLLPPFHLDYSHVQPRPGIRPMHIAVINLLPGVASLSILVNFHRWLHLAQLTPGVNAVGHQPIPLLTCFPTNVTERCPVSVLDVKLFPMRSTCAFSPVDSISRVHVQLVS